MERSSSVLKKSSAYALASAALGVPAAEAAPIYFSGPNTVYRADPGTPDVLVDLDIDGDQTNDYALDLYIIGNGPYDTYAFWNTLNGNAVVGFHPWDAAALTGGAVVGPNQYYTTNDAKLAKAKANGGTGGQWPNNLGDPRFVGLQFLIGDNTHYGWARVGVGLDASTGVAEGRIYDWAYEDSPDTAIMTPVPEPSSLALFALGAAGVAALKRRRRQD